MLNFHTVSYPVLAKQKHYLGSWSQEKEHSATEEDTLADIKAASALGLGSSTSPVSSIP